MHTTDSRTIAPSSAAVSLPVVSDGEASRGSSSGFEFPAREPWRMVFDFTGVWLLYLLCRSWMVKRIRLAEADYFEPSILWRELQHPPTLGFYALCLLVALFAGRRLGWAAWDGGRTVRGFVMLVTVTCGWAFAAFEYNHYFDQSHLADRLLIGGLTIAVWFHPLWIGPWLAHTLSVVHQLHHPLHAYPWTDKELPFSLLILFLAIVTYGAWRPLPLARYVTWSLCLIGGHYFWAGWQKLLIGWPQHEVLANLVVNAYINGWFPGWGSESIARLADLVARWNMVLIAATLVIELGGLCLPLRRPWAMAVLAGCVALHVGIFLLSGICFWKWIVVDLGLIGLLAISSSEFHCQVFAPGAIRWAALGLILASPLHSKSLNLAWYDTPLCHLYDIEVIGASGTHYPVARGTLAPYDFTFAQNRFPYVSTRPTAVGTFGVTADLDVALGSQQLTSAEELHRLLEAHGESAFDAAKVARLRMFLERFLRNAYEQPTRTVALVPHHIWAIAPAGHYRGQEPFREIVITRRDVLWDYARRQPRTLHEGLACRWACPLNAGAVQLAAGE